MTENQLFLIMRGKALALPLDINYFLTLSILGSKPSAPYP